MTRRSFPLHNPFNKKDLWFTIGGLFLLTWWCANTYVDIVRYGFEQGVYWWFCNLALLGAALGILFKSRGWLIGFLSIACFTQIFWVIDNMYRLFMGENLFGLVEFMYQPGLPLDEFLLSHYHYFNIPLTLLALAYLPSQKSNAIKLILIFNPLIFGVSYFVFPDTQNINCIHESCFPALDDYIYGPYYSFFFWLFCFAMHLLIGTRFERFFANLHLKADGKRLMLKTVGAVVGVSVVLATWDSHYKSTLPTLQCKGTFENASVKLRCRYTLDFVPQKMLFAYEVINKESTAQTCFTKIHWDLEGYNWSETLDLAPGEIKLSRIVIPYPDRHTSVTLSADCHPPVVRALGSK